MSWSFWQLAQTNLPQTIGSVLLVFVIYLVLGLLPFCGGLYLMYFLLTLPMRRNERARLFLDVLTLGLKEGRTPESAITEAASSHDDSLSVRFHLLSVHLEQGMRLSEGLIRVSRLLPPEVNAMLRIGERIGDVAKVLPACRRHLADAVSRVRSANNYLILLVFVFTPVLIFLPIVFRIKVLPAYRAVFSGVLEGSALPAFSQIVFSGSTWVTAALIGMVGILWLATLAYLGGPRLRERLRQWAPGLVDWCLIELPWRKKRALRDFSAMLAVLLDAGVPEPEALSLAAQTTGNRVMERRAGEARALLGQGIQLPEAICRTHDSPELRWRLGNALRHGGSFVRTLTGWHEALDAQAFQLEQSAAQVATTLMVLLNGLLVGSLVIAIFLALIRLINEAVLW